jgi:antitoxin CptB
MDRDTRLKRLKFRAWHRGTREADMMIGGFLDAHGAGWNDEEMAWFESFLEEQDVDIMAWALRAQPVPGNWQGRMMDAFQRLDFIAPIA